MLSEIFMQINRRLTKLQQLKLGGTVIVCHHVQTGAIAADSMALSLFTSIQSQKKLYRVRRSISHWRYFEVTEIGTDR